MPPPSFAVLSLNVQSVAVSEPRYIQSPPPFSPDTFPENVVCSMVSMDSYARMPAPVFEVLLHEHPDRVAFA